MQYRSKFKSLEMELLKIGRVLSTRWAASSFRYLLAIWNNYDAFIEYFGRPCVSRQNTQRKKHERWVREQ